VQSESAVTWKKFQRVSHGQTVCRVACGVQPILWCIHDLHGYHLDQCCAILAEQCYAGERVQSCKASTTLTIFGSALRDITGTLDWWLVKAMETALQGTKCCILDTMLHCQASRNFLQVVFLCSIACGLMANL